MGCMTPPRDFDAASAGGSLPEVDEYDAIVLELDQLQGTLNATEARVVELTKRAIEIGVSGGTNLSPAQWLEWRAGMAPGRAADLVRLAKRYDELPHTVAALSAGELSLDQAALVARHVPARYDQSAARVASCCTVRQLRKALPWFRDPKPESEAKPGAADDTAHVTSGYDEHGYFCTARLPESLGAVVDQALKAMLEDLKRQAKADAPEGSDPQPVSLADALVALAETALRAGEAARPGTDRYLVHAHLEAGPHGLELMSHLGIPLPEGQRRHILCDAKLRGLVHDETGAPLGSGRTTRAINRRMRRAIEHRDGGCSVPGCGRTHGLEIHHIWHWEDGGPTETWNLVALCAYHHACHHRGALGIEGNADLPRHTAPGVVFTDAWGHALDPVGSPIRPAPRPADVSPVEHLADAAALLGVTARPYLGPTGERLDRHGFYLRPDGPDPADLDAPGAGPEEGDAVAEPPPAVAGRRPREAAPDPNGPLASAHLDPTRAGPRAR